MLLRPALSILALATVAPAFAQCPHITFDDRAVGAVITTQYPGVTFSTPFVAQPHVYDVTHFGTTGYTTSGTRVLTVGNYPDSDSDTTFLRMTFTRPQREVEFTVGEPIGCASSETIDIRVYDTTGNSILSLRQAVPVNGLRRDTCDSRVRLASSDVLHPIGTIEVGGGAGGCIGRLVFIDDLSYDIDTTPPITQITSPAEDSCTCDGAGFQALSYDPDGQFESARLEYSTALSGPWTPGFARTLPVGPASGPIGGVGGIPDGWRYFRLTTRNICGLESSAYTRLYVDNTPPTFALSRLADNAAVRGNVCLYGAAYDACGLSYTVLGKPAAAPDSAYIPIAGPGPFTANISSGTIAQWNTSSTADGAYDIQVRGSDPCGHPAQLVRRLIIDNTPPAVALSSPATCTYQSAPIINIVGSDFDANLASWSVEVVGGPYTVWTTLPALPGDPPRNANASGTLARFDRSALPACLYALRITAADRATDGCPDGIGGHSTEKIAVIDARCPADHNRTGAVSVQDVFDFLRDYFMTCP